MKYWIMGFLEVALLACSIWLYTFICDDTNVNALREFYISENNLLFKSDDIEEAISGCDGLDNLVGEYMYLRLTGEFAYTGTDVSVDDCRELLPDNLGECYSHVKYYIKSYSCYDQLLVATTDAERVEIYKDLMFWSPLLHNSVQGLLIAYGRRASFICVVLAIFLMVLSLLLLRRDNKKAMFVYK